MNLNPCPFCTSKACAIYAGAKTLYVHCSSCDASGPSLPYDPNRSVTQDVDAVSFLWNDLNLPEPPPASPLTFDQAVAEQARLSAYVANLLGFDVAP